MKININDFWQEIGTVFNNPEDLMSGKNHEEDEEFVVLPKGTYLIVDKDTHGYKLYEIYKNKNVFFEPDWILDQEFVTVYTPPQETLELALDSVTKTILTLTAEGWKEDPDNPHFDITPELYKLQVITDALSIIKQDNQEEA